MCRIAPLVVVFLALLLSGCAVGNKYDYASSKPGLTGGGKGQVEVAVHDQRPYVVYADKTPDFVGLQRAGFGNPWDVRTKSGMPLSDDMLQALAEGLRSAGFTVAPVNTSHAESPSVVLDRLTANAKGKILVVTIMQWKTDTYNNVKLLFDLKATLYTKMGKYIAESRVQGEENLGGNAWNPPAHATKASPVALSRKLEELLASPEMKIVLYDGN